MIITYRPAEKKDLPKIELIIKEAYDPLIEVISRKPGALEDTTQKIKKDFMSQNLFVILGEGKKAIGTFSLKQVTVNLLKLYHFAIDPKFQNQGIGTSILRDFIEEITRKMPEITRIELEIYEKSQRLSHFYTKLGFNKKGEKIIRGVRIIILFRDLKIN
ncbi:MAG: GNAT family N-acetyltransferase [Candidatus Hodarchaeales archaeon]|jgi:ribosomal protein S18 acetylase RimI-like enzyme